MVEIYDLTTEQEKFFLKYIFDFQGKEPFKPTHIQFMDDVSNKSYIIIFLAKNVKGLAYTLGKSGGVDAGFLSVEETNNIIEYKEVMIYADKKFETLPTYIFNDIKKLFR